MSNLPVHAVLGIEQPRTRVLSWYLACVRPNEYDACINDVAQGRELVNPIDAFESIIRNNQPIATYKAGLEYATNCFPRSDAMAREATRWMLRWEPELTRSISRTLLGEHIQEDTHNWTNEKNTAFALIAAQMMASNWENKTFVDRWNQRLSYRNDITPERRQVAAAKAYWTLMSAVHSDWTETVWAATLTRANPKHRESLETALGTSHDQLQKRAPNQLPGLSKMPTLPGLPTQALVAPPRAERNAAVPAQ